ncbi:hypothetical protein BHM03_00043191 [Ensete ventricosum]|nr:hypothetical protein BHM03_00043191 [Ensete ventricosum]
MYRERGGCGSKVDIGAADRKRINDALDRHLERSSPSTSRGLNGKEKGRLSMPSVNSGKQPEHRTLSKSKLSDVCPRVSLGDGSGSGEQRRIPGSPLSSPSVDTTRNRPRRSKLTVIVRQQLPTVEIDRYRPKVVVPFSLSGPYRPASSSAGSVAVATPAFSSRSRTSRVLSDTPIPILSPSTSSSSSPVAVAFRCPTVSPPPQQLPLPSYCHHRTNTLPFSSPPLLPSFMPLLPALAVAQLRR